MRSQVDLVIEGIPSHVWTRDTAAELLGTGCLVDSLAPETANRDDLSLFKLRAWCVDPDEVLVAKRLWVLEPEVVGSPADRRPTSRQLLDQGACGSEGLALPPSSDGSGQSGLPEDSGSFSGSGEWRALPWSRGVRDARGGAPTNGAPASGAPGGSYRQALLGRIGPSDWRIPPMTMGVAGMPPRSAMPAMRAASPAPAVVAVADPGPGAVPAMEIAPTAGLAAEDLRGGTAVQELVVAEAVRTLSSALGQELPPTAGKEGIAADSVLVEAENSEVGDEDKSTDSVLVEAANPEVDAAATVGIGPVVSAIPEETGLALVPAPGQRHVPYQEGMLGASVQVDVPTPGWAPVEEISSVVPLHAVAGPDRPVGAGSDPEPELDGALVGCMETHRLVVRDSCMDGDLPMHVQTDLLLPPKEQIAVANIKAFCTGLLKKLAPPLLKEIEAVRGKGVALETSRRNTRSSSACAPKKTALGIIPDGLAVTDEALGQLRQMFDSPIQEPQLRAMAAIFGKAIPFDLGTVDASRVALLA
ncbi:hypothetical protein VPH35_122633 [Triticum aestivum]